MAGVNFRRIPTLLTAEELVDKAFRRGSRVTTPTAKDAFASAKAREIARVRSVQNTVDATLHKYVKAFPSFEHMDPFYRDLAKAVVDVDRVRQGLGAIDWARKQITKIADDAVGRMKRAKTGDRLGAERRHVYGRVASLVGQVGGDLQALNAARNDLRKLPTMDPALPTIVVAGYPNVGKSSLIRRVSTAEPEVASYPFTTKGVAVGHFELNRVKYQIVDTPGLLDRPLEERNPIERQAVAALDHLGDAVLFLLDPTEHCGYPMEAQERLLEDVQEVFTRGSLLVAENKADIAEGKFTGREERRRISTLTGDGVDELVAEAASAALASWREREVAASSPPQ